MKWSIAAALAVCVAVLGVWLGGVRIIVIQPIGAIPDGVTAIIAGVEGPNFVDSPDAICNRTMGGVSLLCRGMVAARIVNQGYIVARLPYSETLFRLTGGPFRDD
ncbi:hypothetical protein FJ567_00540 [Mesorhizobium sp. B2-4-16]|nr:hypothetical protein FJ567_00540 [Mesorhizobium sp. B2-4-16]TPL75369.1 hypothetical protein FJ956_06025 [Mesorhizobium sp. B2-4-3]